MVYISKVYTKFGDKGETMLADGSTAPKNSLRVECYGGVDELNATIGMVRLELGRETPRENTDFGARADATLARIQQELFNLGSELSTPRAATGNIRLKIEALHIQRLEQEIDALNEKLSPLTSFILPGGGPASTAAHLARTVCRRAERRTVELATKKPCDPKAFVISTGSATTFSYSLAPRPRPLATMRSSGIRRTPDGTTKISLRVPAHGSAFFGGTHRRCRGELHQELLPAQLRLRAADPGRDPSLARLWKVLDYDGRVLPSSVVESEKA